MIFGSNAVSFLNYLYHIVMVRLLGLANYGELAAIISLVGLLGVIPGSLNLVVIKHISSARNDKEVSSLINWLKMKVLIISLVFSFIILLVSPFISSFLHINKTYFLVIVAISLFFSIQSLLNRSILQGLLKFKEFVVSMLVENSVKIVTSFLLVYFSYQVGGAMVGLAVSALIGWHITNLFLRYTKQQTNTITVDTKQVIVSTVPIFLQSIAITSLYSSDVILVKHFFSTYDAGIYAALSNLGKIIFFGAGPIGAVMFPLVSKKSVKGEGYKQIFIYSFFATLLLALSIVLAYWLFPGFAINLLYGKLYLGAESLLVWFGIFISFFTLATLFVSYNLSLGKNSVVILPLIAALTQILLIWFFHSSLFLVIIVSILVTALLLLSLLIYSIYEKKFFV